MSVSAWAERGGNGDEATNRAAHFGFKSTTRPSSHTGEPFGGLSNTGDVFFCRTSDSPSEEEVEEGDKARTKLLRRLLKLGTVRFTADTPCTRIKRTRIWCRFDDEGSGNAEGSSNDEAGYASTHTFLAGSTTRAVVMMIRVLDDNAKSCLVSPTQNISQWKTNTSRKSTSVLE